MDLNKSEIQSQSFGKANGVSVQLYSICFPGKLEAKVTNYGGIITSMRVPDKNGKLEEVVLGHDNLQDYLNQPPYFGALIGRYSNRIARGQFELEGEQYNLAINDGQNHLHGGIKGFDKVVWEVISVEEDSNQKVLKLRYISIDGEEGFPGTLTTIVKYTFTPDSFEVSYEATTDKPTLVNLTQHSYFNLSGDMKEDVLGHKLAISATHFLPTDSTLIPNGELREVTTTPFDFTTPKLIGTDIGNKHEQLMFAGGYDHCWVLFQSPGTKMRKAANVRHEGSGREMHVHTTEPGIQFYSGNFLDGSITGRDGIQYEKHFGLCLETQHFPDSPNQKGFPSVILKPGEKYQTQTKYTFSTI